MEVHTTAITIITERNDIIGITILNALTANQNPSTLKSSTVYIDNIT